MQSLLPVLGVLQKCHKYSCSTPSDLGWRTDMCWTPCTTAGNGWVLAASDCSCILGPPPFPEVAQIWVDPLGLFLPYPGEGEDVPLPPPGAAGTPNLAKDSAKTEPGICLFQCKWGLTSRWIFFEFYISSIIYTFTVLSCVPRFHLLPWFSTSWCWTAGFRPGEKTNRLSKFYGHLLGTRPREAPEQPAITCSLRDSS